MAEDEWTCPECGESFSDPPSERYPATGDSHPEVHVTCPNCGSTEEIPFP